MLEHNEDLCLPTKKLYTVPDGQAYLAAKTAYLNEGLPNYANKTLIEKWQFLIEGMKGKFVREEMPILSGVQIDIETCNQRFEQFKTQRQNTSVSYYNLSLEQCVSYFEDFYFIYTTDSPQYRLRVAEKRDFIKSILEAMGHCETGINGQFYAVLQAYQKDTNWILAENTKARCEIIKRLSDEYNLKHHIGDALSIHTFDRMVALANNEGLGIPKKETILDAYGWLSNKKAIKEFFAQHQAHNFQHYEKTLETTLSTHIFSELVVVLPGINAQQWETQAVDISLADVNALGQFLTNYFPVISEGKQALFLINDEDSFSAECKLKSKPECIALLRDLIKQKLLSDGYFVNLTTVVSNRNRDDLLKLHNGISMEMFLHFYKVLHQEEQNEIGYKQGELLLNTYPDLLYPILRRQPEVITKVKPWIKSSLLTDELLRILEDELTKAINEKNKQKIDSLLRSLLNLIHPNCDYITQISPHILANPQVQATLLETDGTFLGYLLENTWSEDNIRVAEKTNSRIRGILTAVQNRDTWADLQVHDDMSLLQKVKKITSVSANRELTNTPNVDIQTFMHLVKEITPLELVSIITERKTRGLSPLPFCNASNVVSMLKTFQKAASTLGNEWAEQGYLAIKRKACVRQRDSMIEGDAIAYLARSNDWFIGFIQYQQQRIKSSYILENSKQFLKALGKAILFVIALYLLWHMTWAILPSIITFLDNYAVYIVLTWLAGHIINIRLRNRLLATVNFLLDRMLVLDGVFLALMFGLAMLAVKAIYNQLVEFLRIIPFVVETLEQRSQAPAYFSNEHSAQGWEEQCDKIIRRLQIQDEPAAEQKSIILLKIKERIAEEDNPHDAQLLYKKYPIIYQNREYQVSFAEVAKQRRDKPETFSLEPVSKVWCGLFTIHTSSEDLLPKMEQTATVGMNA